MEALIGVASSIFWVLIAITILVFVHELGHFLAAKFFGMRVEKFSVGFPPKIFGKKVGETEYVVGATPLGGYVKISGMVDESMDTGYAAKEPEPHEFRAKPVWQRIVVIVAGVTFNILFAIAIFIGLKYGYGELYISADTPVLVAEGSIAHEMGMRTGDRIMAVNDRPLEQFDEFFRGAILVDSMTVNVERNGTRETLVAHKELLNRLNRPGAAFGVAPAIPSLIGNVPPGTPAYQAGLQGGDRIVEIDGQPIQFWDEMVRKIQASEGQPMTLKWVRRAQAETADADRPEAIENGQEQVATAANGNLVFERAITPRESDGQYLLGVHGPSMEMLAGEAFNVEYRGYSFGESLVQGTRDTWDATSTIMLGFQRIVTGRENFRESVGGPIAIAQITRQAASHGAQTFWSIVALLSITLAIINILPIPALDGGHLMFLLYEGITRREPSLRVRMVMQQIGMVVLIAFMMFVIFNDIMRL